MIVLTTYSSTTLLL